MQIKTQTAATVVLICSMVVAIGLAFTAERSGNDWFKMAVAAAIIGVAVVMIARKVKEG